MANDESVNQQGAADGDESVVHHQSARQKRGVEPGGMQLNLTSMIDIIFLLLIYFVITANFTPDEGVLTAKVPAPEGEGASEVEPPDKDELKIVLTDSGETRVRISIDKQGSFGEDFEALFKELESLKFDPVRNTNGVYKADHPVLIEPTANVRWQHAANAFNAAIRAKFENVSFSKPQD